MDDTISRQAAIDAAVDAIPQDEYWIEQVNRAIEALPSAQPEQQRTFIELVVGYPEPELCTYKEYKGKPYYSIKYIENGKTYIGYGTYKPKVLSQFLSEYFISSAQPEQRWIPCDETVEIPDHEVLACDKFGEERLGYLEYADEQWICESEGYVMYDPIAWMEKPEPYKGGQDE